MPDLPLQSERKKKLKICLMALLLCNNMHRQKRQLKRRHRKRNKILERDLGLQWMAGRVLPAT